MNVYAVVVLLVFDIVIVCDCVFVCDILCCLLLN